MATQYRQGDVFLVRVSDLPQGAVPEELAESRVILAYGEVTGHAHALDPMLASTYTFGAERFLMAKPGATLVHEEHGAITLEPGIYRIRRQREYSPLEIRPVCD